MKGRAIVLTALACLLAALHPVATRAETVLRAVMHSDLKIIDPVWTTANITRNHGYMIYDTLFALDEKGDLKLQMLEKYEVSEDGLTYTFRLRDGFSGTTGCR
jgi:peptide/nickel transport system substrate-binding protein